MADKISPPPWLSFSPPPWPLSRLPLAQPVWLSFFHPRGHSCGYPWRNPRGYPCDYLFPPVATPRLLLVPSPVFLGARSIWAPLDSIWFNMVQYGTKSDHLEYLGDHGPRLVQDENPDLCKRHPPRVGLPGFPLNDTLQGFWASHASLNDTFEAPSSGLFH